MNPRTNLILLFSALMLVHLLFFMSNLIRPPESFSDSTEYLNAAQNLYKQGVLYCGDLSDPIREELYTRRPPLYPLLLGLSLATGSDLPMFALQALFSLLSVFLIIQIFGPRPASRMNLFYMLLVMLLLFTPAQFIYTNRIMAEIPFQLALVLMTWSLYRYFEPREEGKPAHSGSRFIWLFYLMMTLGMAIKPVLFPFVIPSIIGSVLLFIRTKKVVWMVALFLPIIWITAYSIYNMNRTGSVQYSSIQTANMVNYNLRYFIMAQEGSDQATELIDSLYVHCGEMTGYPEKNRCLMQGVRERIMKQPFAYGLYNLKGSVRYFLDPGRFDLATYFSLQTTESKGILEALHQEGFTGIVRFMKSQGWGWVVVLGLIGIFKLLKLTGFLIYLFRGKSGLPFRIFLLLLVGYLAVVTGPLGASRFLLPVELIIIGAALKGWIMLLQGPESPDYNSSIL